MSANYWPRLIGANILAAFFAPDAAALWVDCVAHVAVMFGLLLITSPARQGNQQ